MGKTSNLQIKLGATYRRFDIDWVDDALAGRDMESWIQEWQEYLIVALMAESNVREVKIGAFGIYVMVNEDCRSDAEIMTVLRDRLAALGCSETVS